MYFCSYYALEKQFLIRIFISSNIFLLVLNMSVTNLDDLKMSVADSDEQTEKFIDLVRTNRVIYDKSQPKYNNKLAKAIIFKKIADESGFSGN